MRDVLRTYRGLLQRPGFFLAVVFTMALGIGANSAIFSVVDAVTGFSIVALPMAAVGIYGLIQYSIATRTHKIGIRMAIGAQAGGIFRMIIGEGLKLSLTGLVLGLIGALLPGRAGASLLFGVTATDPLTFVTVSLLLTAVAAAACYVPARRAVKVEPVVALRQE